VIATNNFALYVAAQTARGVYPAAATYKLRVLDGGLSSKPAVDRKNVADGSIWTPSLQRIGFIETGGEFSAVAEPLSTGLLLKAGIGTDTVGGGADPYSHVITPATAMSGFKYLSFWQYFDGEWSVFRDCQVAGLELTASIDDRFMVIRPTIIGMAREQKCSALGAPPAAESDAYHWLDAAGYWCLFGEPANIDHSDVPTDAAGLYTWLAAFKTAWNAHCAVATGVHHKAADAVNVLSYATPVAALADAYVALDEIETKYEAHRVDTTVHYFADATNTLSWATPATEAAALACAELVIGRVNSPGVYNRHLGVVAGLKNINLSIGMDAKSLQGEDMTAYVVHRGKGSIKVACEQLMEDFRLYNLAKYGDPAAVAGTDVTSEIQHGALNCKFTASVSGAERSIQISVPQFDFDPEPITGTVGNPDGNEIYLTVGGEASGTAPVATVTVKNSAASY